LPARRPNRSHVHDLAVVAALAGHVTDSRACSVPRQLNGPVQAPDLRVVRFGGTVHEVVIEDQAEGALARVEGDDPIELIGRWAPGQLRFRGTVDGRRRIVQIAALAASGRSPAAAPATRSRSIPAHVAELTRHMIEKVPPDLSRFLIAPMPGLLTALNVGEGDKVEAGQPLAVVEAMKMENILRAQKSAHGETPRRRQSPANSLGGGGRRDPGIRVNRAVFPAKAGGPR
jgi:propionyl-CoA carboxylase alpha chain